MGRKWKEQVGKKEKLKYKRKKIKLCRREKVQFQVIEERQRCVGKHEKREIKLCSLPNHEKIGYPTPSKNYGISILKDINFFFSAINTFFFLQYLVIP